MPILAESIADIGRYLRDVREAQALDLYEVAGHIHIRAKYLEAIETGNLAELPGTAYLRGYLANYAGFLGLDRRQVLDAYERVVNPNPKKIYFIPEPTRQENAPGIGVMVLAAVIMGIAYILWFAFIRDDGEVDVQDDMDVTILEPHEYQRLPNLTDDDCFGYKAPFYYPPCYGPGEALLDVPFVEDSDILKPTQAPDAAAPR